LHENYLPSEARIPTMHIDMEEKSEWGIRFRDKLNQFKVNLMIFVMMKNFLNFFKMEIYKENGMCRARSMDGKHHFALYACPLINANSQIYNGCTVK
jgi:hypothetical protein